jgi:hypothetical protein
MALAKPSSTINEMVLQLYSGLEKTETKEVRSWLESRVTENTGVTIGEYL